MGSFNLPLTVVQRLTQMGGRVRLARLRRGWTVAELAEKAGLNRNTMAAIEAGKPGVGIGAWITVIWALGLDQTLDGVADPDLDQHGKSLEASRRPARAGKPRKVDDNYEF